MAKIRVLVVDDSVLFRHVISENISKDPEVEVVGIASNGQLALTKIAQLKPDIVTLDLEMPIMDGMETLAEIRKTNRTLPIIIFSGLSQRGAAKTLEALALGASDYLAKPSDKENPMQQIQMHLIPKIKALCRRATQASQKKVDIKVKNREESAVPQRVKALIIGVSTGGPNALAELLPALTKDFPVPIFIVQHMPPNLTALLADRLETLAGFPVREGLAGEIVRPGCAWLAPGGLHMEVAWQSGHVEIVTHHGPPENSCRPAVDVLFRSAVRVYGSGTLAVILTGMGQDGLIGCEAVRESNGRIITQDEATSVVWGMPGAVSQAGLADKILPLPDIAFEINRRVSSKVANLI